MDGLMKVNQFIYELVHEPVHIISVHKQKTLRVKKLRSKLGLLERKLVKKPISFLLLCARLFRTKIKTLRGSHLHFKTMNNLALSNIPHVHLYSFLRTLERNPKILETIQLQKCLYIFVL